MVLDDRQRFDWLRLTRTEGVGPRTFHGLITRFGGAGAALEALPELARTRGRPVRIPERAEIERELAAAARHDVRFIALGEAEYPSLLPDIDGPPPLLAVKGRVELLAAPCFGIVGARNASANARKLAGMFARGMGEAGYVVVSGFARGIDTEAHSASLTSGTIAVLAGGIDKPYPPENAKLFDELAEKGVLISEMPMGHAPRGKDFPRRNRLISGLSLGIVVVEGARRSGSLITARLAGEQGREVFAVPGSPLDPRCEGTNDLLKAGATLATSSEDILAILRPMTGQGERGALLFREPVARPLGDELFNDDDAGADADAGPDDTADGQAFPSTEAPAPAEARVLALLSATPVDVDHLARIAGLAPRALQAILLDLELSGIVLRHGGNRVSRAG